MHQTLSDSAAGPGHMHVNRSIMILFPGAVRQEDRLNLTLKREECRPDKEYLATIVCRLFMSNGFSCNNEDNDYFLNVYYVICMVLKTSHLLTH